jgi:phospholipase D1/2
MFTHHQKTIIVDADPQPGHDKRRVVAFVGGLDLCDGRYDCGDHPLYETCAEGGPHCSDMHQPCIEGE